MDDTTPEPTPDSPQSQAPDGWELACIGIMRGKFGRRQSQALKKAVMQLSAEQAWLEEKAEAARVGWWRRIVGAFSVHWRVDRIRGGDDFVGGNFSVEFLSLDHDAKFAGGG